MNSLLDNLSPIFSELGSILAQQLLKQNPEQNVIRNNENLEFNSQEEKKEVVEVELNKEEQKVENIVDKPKENVVDTIILSKDEYKSFKLLERSMNRKKEKLVSLKKEVKSLKKCRNESLCNVTFLTFKDKPDIEVSYHHGENKYSTLFFSDEETMVNQLSPGALQKYKDYPDILYAYQHYKRNEKEIRNLLKQVKVLKEELDM